MDRRKFINNLLDNSKKNLDYSITEIKGNLEEYNGNWGVSEAKHLLKRALFGFDKNYLDKALTYKTASECIDELTKIQPLEFDPPIKFIDIGEPNELKVGETWINSGFSPGIEFEKIISLKAWWFGKILNQDFNIREKMTLFWHNHFATEASIVGVGIFQYYTNQLYREYCLGNFKTLVDKVTIDPTMLLYLNGNENVAGRPNENYARELFELFTLGKGSIIGEGNYTFFTEDDIREAAKVLTGWNLNIRNGEIQQNLRFYPLFHDSTIKQFSAAFQNKTIMPAGENEYKQLINMIFEQVEVSKFIIRKLYRWFIYYHIDDRIEQEIIEPLALFFRQNNYEIQPVIRKLLKSNHFFDVATRGLIIKNPLDFICGLIKNLETQIYTRGNPGFEEYTNRYLAWYNYGYTESAEEQLRLLDPPSVAGWEAYYQVPTYYRTWLSAATIQLRHSYFNGVLSNRGLNRFQVILKASAINFAESISDPYNPNELINEMCNRFFTNELTQNQKNILKLNLVDEGQGDYTWSELWTLYQTNKNSIVIAGTVEQKLSNLLRKALELAEYQLS
jgi:hypothetical protein